MLLTLSPTAKLYQYTFVNEFGKVKHCFLSPSLQPTARRPYAPALTPRLHSAIVQTAGVEHMETYHIHQARVGMPVEIMLSATVKNRSEKSGCVALANCD